MCGRFVSREQAAVEREYHVKVRNPFERVYNAAPTMALPVLRDGDDAREALTMRWGLIPSWWSQPQPPTSTINARSEEAAAKPMWRSALRQARCLVPALGWYEWQVTASGKQPHFIYPPGAPGEVGLCFAGLWAARRDEAGPEQLSFAILTRAASPAVAEVHNRMPVVLAPQAFDDWLGPWKGDAAAHLAEHVAAAVGEFQHHPVSRYVNTPRNQGPACIEVVQG
jgi:putative SOS response-associated peptidase YedK